MAHDVFVSYSQHDKPVADAVVARLERDGVRCWVAPRDITPGTSWGEAIVEAIGASRVMVLVLSAHSNRSRQVVREVERAVAGDVIILPFRVEAIDPTGAMAYFLGTEHWLDALSPPLERHIDRLATTVGMLVAGDSVPRDQLDAAPAVVSRSRRPRVWPWVAGGGTVAAGALAAVLTVALGGDGTGPTAPPVTTSTTTATIPVGLEEAGEYRPLDLDPADGRAPDPVYGIDLAGSMLVYAGGIDGVTRMSVGDAEPRPVDTFGAYDAREVAFDGEWVYALLGEYSGQLLIFGVDGSGGVTLETEGISPSHLEVADGYLYVADHDYVAILDVTVPTEAEVVWEWETPGSTGNPAVTHVHEGIGYFGAGWDGLYLFDVSDPAAPAALGHWISPNWVTGLTVSDGIAYVALGDTGLATVDVSDPAAPVQLGLADVPGFASRVVTAHGHAFVSWLGEGGTLGGVAVVDVGDPEDPVMVETYGRFQGVNGLEILGDRVIVSDEGRGVVVFEITGAG